MLCVCACVCCARRYAGVRADSDVLYTMSITREGFESALGFTLENLVPDKFKLDPIELGERLSTVNLLNRLSDVQLKTLVHALEEVEFKKGQWVFQQGDEGEAFYIIIKGTADAIRTTGPKKHVKLAEIGLWGAFGERALLTSEKRYAGIKATSPILKCLVVSRAVFEEKLGQPLSELLESRYNQNAAPRLKNCASIGGTMYDRTDK